MPSVAKRILWVDDEVELLEPHLLFLRGRGYQVDTTSNGDDALELIRSRSYDLVLLDEQMPGRRGLDVLASLQRDGLAPRVVMVTKSEDDGTLHDAIGRQVDDYIVKPASPRQVLSIVTRLLEGSQLRQQRVARDFAAGFAGLTAARERARGWQDFFRLYSDLVDWDIRLHEAGEAALGGSVRALLAEVRRDFSACVAREYEGWLDDGARPDVDRPILSVDVVRDRVLPLLDRTPVLFVVLDGLRLDQWRVLKPLLTRRFDLDESLGSSILPTATPYARNALFSGRFAEDFARELPEGWERLEHGPNDFEDVLLTGQLRRLGVGEYTVHYEKVSSDAGADDLVTRVRGALREDALVAVVFNFADMLAHGRSESAVLREVAPDAAALRTLTRQWFERSAARRVLEAASARGARVVLTTDHGSVQCERPLTIYARRDVSSGLRHKVGRALRVDDEGAVMRVDDPRRLRLPTGRDGDEHILALEDRYLVFPTRMREFQARFRGAFLHGGISPEEMILPMVTLTPR